MGGRPRTLHTGKPGRPRKLRGAQTEESSDESSSDESDESEPDPEGPLLPALGPLGFGAGPMMFAWQKARGVFALPDFEPSPVEEVTTEVVEEVVESIEPTPAPKALLPPRVAALRKSTRSVAASEASSDIDGVTLATGTDSELDIDLDGEPLPPAAIAPESPTVVEKESSSPPPSMAIMEARRHDPSVTYLSPKRSFVDSTPKKRRVPNSPEQDSPTKRSRSGRLVVTPNRVDGSVALLPMVSPTRQLSALETEIIKVRTQIRSGHLVDMNVDIRLEEEETRHEEVAIDGMPAPDPELRDFNDADTSSTVSGPPSPFRCSTPLPPAENDDGFAKVFVGNTRPTPKKMPRSDFNFRALPPSQLAIPVVKSIGVPKKTKLVASGPKLATEQESDLSELSPLVGTVDSAVTLNLTLLQSVASRHASLSDSSQDLPLSGHVNKEGKAHAARRPSASPKTARSSSLVSCPPGFIYYSLNTGFSSLIHRCPPKIPSR